MHDVKEFAEDRQSGVVVERRYRPWCVCGWVGIWTSWADANSPFYNKERMSTIRAAANKQFMGHLEEIQPTRVVVKNS